MVNYDNITSLANIIKDHTVRTIISAISIVSDETSQSQLNLIYAAKASGVTERFIPSEYGFINVPE